MRTPYTINADTLCEEEGVMSSHYPRFSFGIFLSLCIFLLMAMTFTPVTFAASYPSQDSSFREDIERAGASVVRLVVNYTPTSGTPLAPGQDSSSKSLSNSVALFDPNPSSGNSITCTGLGFIVASWANATPTTPPAPTPALVPTATVPSTTTTQQNNTWIMTDGTLVNKSGTPTASSCSTVQGKPSLKLSSIQIIFSSKYNSTPTQMKLSNFNQPIACGPSNDAKCDAGPVLFGFTSNELYPYLDVFQRPSNTSVEGIALSNSGTTLKVPTFSTTPSDNPQQFITPFKVPIVSMASPQFDNVTKTQVGMPIVNAHGFLQSMYASISPGTTGPLSQPIVPNTVLQTLLMNNNIDPRIHANTVAEDWNNGITDYAQGPSFYAQAHQAFADAFRQNSQFSEAETWANNTASASGSGNRSTTSSPRTQQAGITLPFFGVFIPLWLLILAIAGIILLIVLLILLSRLFKNGQQEHPVPTVKREVQPIHIGDAYQPQQAQHLQPTQQPPLAQQAGPQMLQMPQMPQEMSPALHATHNGAAAMSMPPAPVPPAMPVPNMPISPVSGRGDIANQPTLVDFNQPTPPHGQVDSNVTVPIGKLVQASPAALTAQELGFEVITNTNVGLKRMHKPNEDSLFAIHGVRDVNGTLQQIGLFIVADGMGGHADGKVASTLAIQTLINHVLPRLMQHKEPLDNPAQLLAEGVQNANHAVHLHNMENHGDMGTTVTATMLIGTTAYVANVGDSRTYLYRSPNGLSKITRDHSVVASLVDAGIIKEDDIYTHTKRNQIYRSLGEKPYVEVDTFVERLQPGDKLLLCSDGMWEMVRDPNIRRILEEPVSNPRELGERLIQAALDGGGEDNVSIIVVNVLESPNYSMKVGLEPIYKQEEIQLPV